ncbi:MAG: dipeptidase [Candidatus Eisenbacteria bacterium]|uniref:Dipeptidase n=1 Tax=Eiseniibacteriota bacterium TaxID=2212470 RepID=A0A538TE04_UNCEI|nr:MAG: dipeptidase [Candidatus Eisenbacteria bacterium]
MDRLTECLEQDRERYLDDLKAVLRIPSVSAQPDHKDDVARCARHVAEHLKSLGMTRAEVVPTAGHPVVHAEWLGAPGKPTVLLYGHYDVQPPEPLELWKSGPFEPVVRDGKLYARGACDDKGQVYMHLGAIAAHMKTSGKLPINVKLVIEGEEEVGSDHLEAFLRERRRDLDADVIVVSDTSMMGPDQPALCYALRGILYTQIEVVGPTRDLHSGEFGGAVANPANALCAIVAALKDGDGRITVPGFYDRVRALSPAEREAMRSLPFDEAGFLKESGAPQAFGEKGFTTMERIWARPTLDVNGMWSGYIGEGSKTVLPSFAAAKVSMRLVPDQDPDDLMPRIESHVKKLAPPGVTVALKDLHSAPPFLTSPDHPMLGAARRALERAWGKPPVMIREGGSIPVMATFQKTHGLPCILMGFGLHDDQVHAPNEKFSLSSFYGGTKSAAYLYQELART